MDVPYHDIPVVKSQFDGKDANTLQRCSAKNFDMCNTWSQTDLKAELEPLRRRVAELLATPRTQLDSSEDATKRQGDFLNCS